MMIDDWKIDVIALNSIDNLICQIKISGSINENIIRFKFDDW